MKQVADILIEKLGKDRVFYDGYFEEELAVPDMDVRLQEIYRNQSDLVVPFFCAGYERKRWCKLEWKAIRSSIMERQEPESLMAIRLDETEIPGFHPIDGYIDAKGRPPREIANLIMQRVRRKGSQTENPPSDSTIACAKTSVYEGLEPEEKELLVEIYRNEGYVIEVRVNESVHPILVVGRHRFHSQEYAAAFRGVQELGYLEFDTGQSYVLTRAGRKIAKALTHETTRSQSE